MEDKMIILIVFGTMLTIYSIVLIFISFKFFYKYLIQEKKCDTKTKGIVKRYTYYSIGNNTGISLPVVYYNVNGIDYKVVGPKYRNYKVRSVTSPTSENKILECFEDKNGVLNIKYETNSFFGVIRNPMCDLYPIGTELDVYYSFDNPKIAYVVRYCNNKWIFYLTFFAGIICLLLDIFVFILCLVIL